MEAAAVALRARGRRAALLIGRRVVADAAALKSCRLAASIASCDRRQAAVRDLSGPAWQRGAGIPPVTGRLPYLGEHAATQLEGIDAPGPRRRQGSPVSFFAYPDQPSDLVPPGCRVHHLAGPGDDAVAALHAVAASAGAAQRPRTLADAARPGRPSGPLTPDAVAAAVGALLPEGAVVVDEAITSGSGIGRALGGAPPHDLLTLTGGAIGFGLPTGVGAAVACPDRPVVCLQADGSAMYTVSALWTQAREGLDVTTIIYDNRSYAILALELARVDAGVAGPVGSSLLDLGRPDLDFRRHRQGHGRAGNAGVDGRGAGRRPGAGVGRAGPAPDRRHRLAPGGGLEPPTFGSKGRCSAN